MGLLFNTPQTIEMAARVNREFSANMAVWKARAAMFDGTHDLHWIATNVHPPVVPGDAHAQGRWQVWLKNILHGTACPPLIPYDADFPATVQYPVPAGAGGSTVGDELVKLFSQALNDGNCAEIVMVIQPDVNVYIAQAETIPANDGVATDYTLAITICTVAVP
jgi:hypothetical protein